MSDQFKLDHLSEVIECEYLGNVNFAEQMQAIEGGVAILQDDEYPNLIAAKMCISRLEKKTLAAYIL